MKMLLKRINLEYVISFGYILIEKKRIYLKVPQNRINNRLQDPPKLRGPTIEILGIGEEEAAGDIVVSSAGTYLFIRHASKEKFSNLLFLSLE
jgi:hypothetical protein